MGVYIKGMEMPTSCYKCHMKQRDGMYIVCPVAHERFSVADVNILDYRLDNCPIIPVQPHGDLIDRKELIKDDHQHYEYMSDEFYVTVRDIECAPTIISAEDVTQKTEGGTNETDNFVPGLYEARNGR